jgi:hypothetical protein
MVIDLAHGLPLSQHGRLGEDPWVVQGYRADASVIGGPLIGETCKIAAGQPFCHFGVEGAMAPGARVERDLETTRIFYSAACFRDAGCPTANDASFPYAGLSISGSVVTVRDFTRPRVIVSGALLRAGWHTADDRLGFAADDNVDIRQLRLLVDGREAQVVRPACDARAMAPCAQVPARSSRFGDKLPDGRRTVGVEATDSAVNVKRVYRAMAVDRHGPALAFVPSSGRGRRIAVEAPDASAGTTGGTIEVRSRRAKRFRALRTRLSGGRLVARLVRGRSRAGLTIRASATDAVGRSSSIEGAPVRLRAGVGRRLRATPRGGAGRRLLVRGRLRAYRGRGLAGRRIVALQRLRVDGARLQQVAAVTTSRRGRFSLRLPAGASRSVRIVAPGGGGLQVGLRRLHVRVPWSSSLRISPRAVAPGGTIRLSGRLRTAGLTLPESGKLVELQAFDRGRWRVFETTRARGPRARWTATYRFLASARGGGYRIRARIRREGSLPRELGYSWPALVRVR